MIASDAYSEISVKISDVSFMFFIDGGFFSAIRESSKIHSHKFNEIIFVFKGNIDIPVNGEVYVLEENDMIIIPADKKHSINTDKGSGFVVVSFWTEESKLDKINFIKNFKGASAFLRLLDYYYNNYKYKKELVYSCLAEIAALILERQEPNSGENLDIVTLESDSYRKYIIDNYFLKNYNKSPGLEELSEQLNLSTVQTHRIIKKVYGKSFRKIILSLRMERAKSLLSETNMSVNEISLEVGYPDAHNFFTAFKEATGITPLKYRKNT